MRQLLPKQAKSLVTLGHPHLVEYPQKDQPQAAQGRSQWPPWTAVRAPALPEQVRRTLRVLKNSPPRPILALLVPRQVSPHFPHTPLGDAGGLGGPRPRQPA